MNIYAFAMKMEKDGEDFYRTLATESQEPALKNIFTMLADEELKHFNALKSIKNDEQAPSLATTDLLDKVKNVFTDMRNAKEEPRIDTTNSAREYRKACAIEKDIHTFYLEKAEQGENEHVRELFLRLAHEETTHLIIMENIVEFVSKPEPGNWLENAEWHHLVAY